MQLPTHRLQVYRLSKHGNGKPQHIIQLPYMLLHSTLDQQGSMLSTGWLTRAQLLHCLRPACQCGVLEGCQGGGVVAGVGDEGCEPGKCKIRGFLGPVLVVTTVVVVVDQMFDRHPC